MGILLKFALSGIPKPSLISRTRTGNGAIAVVEAVLVEDGYVAIIGWSQSKDLTASLEKGKTKRPVTLSRFERKDVAEALELADASELGFFIESDLAPNDPSTRIRFSDPASGRELMTAPIRKFKNFSTAHHEVHRNLFNSKKSAEKDGTPAAVVSGHGSPDTAFGFIDEYLVSPLGGGVVAGWVISPPGSRVWFEDETGQKTEFDAVFSSPRPDLFKTFKDNPFSGRPTGFTAFLPNQRPTSRVRMRTEDAGGLRDVQSARNPEILPRSPRMAAEKIFSLNAPVQEFSKRAEPVDWKILGPLAEAWASALSDIAPQVDEFGELPQDPEISIIIPLFGRFDFIEHQLVEFARDRFVRENCEVVFVVDDPSIEQDLRRDAPWLFELFKLPFRMVFGHANRGYSGANNLGVAHSGGRRLLFLNSDVIPQGPGWLESMLRVLEDDDTVGVVGAKLLFANGGVQHQGIEFEYLEQFGIWSNQHPGIGLLPDADAPTLPFETPATTGACMLMDRDLFTDIGGWDTGYIVGDFEDTDLCLSVRQRNKRILVQPQASLIHLERQSFRDIGDGLFRQKLTIVNGVRHQSRWKTYFEAEALKDGH